jgi:hypothetical protein
MLMYRGEIDDVLDKISYSIFNIYCIPTTLIFGLVAVYILVHVLKRKEITEKYRWPIFVYAFLGILSNVIYCGIMLMIIFSLI